MKKILFTSLLLMAAYCTYSQRNASIERKNKTEYLKVNYDGQVKQFDLQKLGYYDQDFELVASSFNENNITFLLKFDYPSNPSGEGMCSEGGIEMGYILLNYDKRLALLDKQRVLLESCNEWIYSEKVPSSSTKVFTYTVSNEMEGDKTTTVIINTQNPSITVKK